MYFTTCTTILVILGITQNAVSQPKPPQQTFEVAWPNATTLRYVFDYQPESECIYVKRDDHLICMRNYVYTQVISRWIYNQDTIKYLFVRCLEQEYFTNHKHTCLCKNGNMAANPQQNKQRDEFTYCQISEIPTNVSDTLTNIELLDLSSNLITNLSVTFFRQMKFLKFVNLTNNPIRDIPGGLFCGLEQLRIVIMQKLSLEAFPWNAFSCDNQEKSNVEMIDFSSSHISEIRDKALQSLPHLLFLNLTNNLLKSLPLTPFLEATALQYLDLSENFISEIPDDFCAGLQSLEKLYLKGNSFQIMDITPFSQCRKLHFIDLSKNRVENLTTSTQEHTGLKVLNLSDNDLVTITQRMFSKSYSNLIHLDISNNDLEDLEEDAFSGLGNLRHLNLSWNRINISPHIDSVGLNELLMIQTLDLSYNMLTILDELLFQNLTNLKNLKLQYNHIRNLAPSAFLGLESLEILHIDNNHINSLPYDVFHHVTSLRTMNLSRNDIATVGSIRFPESLEELDLSFNNLADIPRDLINAKRLFLQGNRITQIPKDAFLKMVRLQVLNLNFNKLRILDTGVFVGLGKLLYLDLSHNFIRDIKGHGVFSDTKCVESLDLSYNSITNVLGLFTNHSLETLLDLQLSNNPIRQLTYSLNPDGKTKRLRRFSCRHCELTNVSKTIFENLKNTMHVDFSWNNLTEFKPFVVSGETMFNISQNPIVCTCNMKWLKQDRIEIYGNYIQTSHYRIQNCLVYPSLQTLPIATIPTNDFLCEIRNASKQCRYYSRVEEGVPETAVCVHDDLQNIPEDLPVSAEVLYLDGNNFWNAGRIDKIGQSMMAVEEIYMNGSRIAGITSHVFANMPYLKKIDLSRNFINVINVGTFRHLSGLKEIYLNNNRIKYIEPGLFSGLLTVQVVDLHANNIEHILPETLMEFSAIPAFRWVYLSRNPWKCDCSNKQFREWIIAHRSRIYDRKNLYCGREEIIRRDAAVFECKKSYFVAVGVAVAATLCMLLVLIIGVAFFCFRRIIVALGYSRFKISSFHCSKTFRLSHRYLYDMVIIYDENDSKCRWWVNKTLLPRLTQQNWTFRVYVANVDVCSQDQLLHDIRYNIQHSQATLFLISQNFPCSYICMASLRYAKYEAAMTGHTILFIAWGEFTREILESDARDYLRRGDYLKIRERFVIDKLICLMPSPISDKSSVSSRSNNHPRVSVTSSLNNLILNTSFDSVQSQ